MLKKLFGEHKDNLNFFFDHIDIKRAEQIFESFRNCKGMLIFTGIGKSGIIAEKLATTMISTGTKSLFLPPMNALHGDIGIVSKEDILIFISKSGENEELLNLIPFIKKKQATTMAWVSNPSSRLLKECDLGIYLPFEKELCPFDLAPTTSAVIQLIFGDVLSIAMMKEKKFSLDEYALNHPAGSLGKKITLKVKDLMLKDTNLPFCRPDDRLREVLFELTNKKCGCVLIVNEQGDLSGIFTDGDLRRALEKDLTVVLEKKMGELMTHSYLATEQEQRVWDTLRFMQKDPKRWVMVLPVLDKKKVVGLIRMHDIVQSGITS